jgi:hypothetical protein
MPFFPTGNGPTYPNYTTLNSRVATFNGLQNNRLGNTLTLAQAGFHRLSNNTIACFYCGLTLHGLHYYNYENPWIEHFVRNSRCAFLKLNFNTAQDDIYKDWEPDSARSLDEQYHDRK